MAAARAEARKRAILARGTDRLAKLTTSARGEDGAHLHDDDQPLSNASGSSGPSTQNFLGEECNGMPLRQGPTSSGFRRRVSERNKATITATTSAASSTIGDSSLFEALSNSTMTTSTPHNPSAWLPEHQQQFMQALMHASAGTVGGNASLPGLSSPIGDPPGLVDPSAPLIDNPFASLMGLMEPNEGEPFPPTIKFPPGMQQFPIEEQKPTSFLQKILPLLHLAAIWCLLAYFVLWAEPKTYTKAATLGAGDSAPKWDTVGLWKRWAELGQESIVLKTFRVRIVPFFWAFTTLEIILHSLHIFTGHDIAQPPSILALALPHLPPPIPSVIIHSFKYARMGSLFLDDLAGVVVGIGFIIYFSGWVTGPS